MQPITVLDTLGVALAAANVDTDQLIPARFMKEPRSVGYGQFLLYDVRHDEQGTPDKEFILHRPNAADAEVMVSRRNFGAGSSREAAVYALVDYGFRCVVAPSFGDIFASNAVNNGLLPAVVEEDEAERLLSALGDAPAAIHVDLDKQVVRVAEVEVSFSISPVWRTKLLNGWDDIDMTRQHADTITDFSAQYTAQFPWTAAQPPESTLISKG
ncbi:MULTISPECIES: 3-isopropylmalate dehydratase small subunit [Halomonadaceae]|jgi:3-isopropylmalate/(R)-2-methylmalate dehydratase small subunit|uniref:3-isopropylmalate dehydratase small subunit n=1 Tax=Halomonadaceae TaxID=28256 RepID=UPI0012EFE163|nr:MULTISPECIES: 3-isopropylmalate dehydratase small subunit [Halomonas]QNU62999.1 3-isopropylmalate dehydratase small subunit [Halomonas titanicae]CAD5249991.1 3-isopropylmalate isomerase subunit [Halomonas sp. I3]CAD5272652.1 3-isopropylmalate isomerase subunit [Halomonas sp. 113]CAD5274433.1 3-isopropylmalate isomerase subunit [Halomonas sp. 59]CAD5279115.1 3-isopropylmalate isomerase subunit [Halomonas sp. 156]|tara:strand:+ start:1384 stop:2022 length:639 start_codon:yes stop_codon:yes gene_type:complete